MKWYEQYTLNRNHVYAVYAIEGFKYISTSAIVDIFHRSIRPFIKCFFTHKLISIVGKADGMDWAPQLPFLCIACIWARSLQSKSLTSLKDMTMRSCPFFLSMSISVRMFLIYFWPPLRLKAAFVAANKRKHPPSAFRLHSRHSVHFKAARSFVESQIVVCWFAMRGTTAFRPTVVAEPLEEHQWYAMKCCMFNCSGMESERLDTGTCKNLRNKS